MTEPNIATMNSTELKAYIDALEEKQRRLLTTLRALLRAREAEELLKEVTNARD